MRFLPTLFLALSLPLVAQAEGRVALVIGSGDYDHVSDLPNPGRDADAVADLLKSLGFKVEEESDPDAEDLRDTLADFAEDAAGAEVALVFYAGHGVEIAGENRLLPTDAATGSVAALTDTSLPLTDIAQTLAALAPAAILLVDACRNDPFAGTPLADATRGALPLEEEATRPIAPGFARVGPAKGLLYAFSTAPGDLAADGPEGANSPFTAALLRHLGKPGLELRTVLTLVTEDVHDRTRGAQTPYFESGLPELVFAAGQPADLSERDALLLAMAGMAQDLRDEIDTLATARNMPLAPLYAAALTLPPDISREDRTKALIEAADAYADFQIFLAQEADEEGRVADLRAEAAAQYDLGAIEAAYSLIDEAKAIDAMAAASNKADYLASTLSQAESALIKAGMARGQFNHETALAALTEAIALYAEAAPLGLPPEAQTKRTQALWDLGDLHLLTGNTTAALAAYRDWNAVAQALSDAAPSDTSLLRDLSVSHNKIGDVLIAQGDLAGALDNYRASRRVAEYLAAQDPKNTEWHHYVWLSHTKIGSVLVEQGELSLALESFDAGIMTILPDMDASNLNNTQWLRDLAVSLDWIGDVLVKKEDLQGALEKYRSSLAITKDLTADDPTNTQWLRDISVSHCKIGDVLRLQQDLPGALESYRECRAIAENLTARDPANTKWQRDLSVSHTKIGDVLRLQGDLRGALESFRESMAIAQDLAARDPGNTLWQRDLSVSHNKIGDVLVAQGDLPGALESYRAGMTIAKDLAALENGSLEAQLDLVVSHYNLSTVSPDPRPDLEAALAILRKLQAEGRLPPANEAWIAFLESELAALPPVSAP